MVPRFNARLTVQTPTVCTPILHWPATGTIRGRIRPLLVTNGIQHRLKNPLLASHRLPWFLMSSTRRLRSCSVFLSFLQGPTALSTPRGRVRLFSSAYPMELLHPFLKVRESNWSGACRIKLASNLEGSRPSLMTDEQPEARREHMTK